MNRNEIVKDEYGIISMARVLRVGSVARGQVQAGLYVKVEFKDGRLSISGVIGPERNGDALGGCGQISMEFAHRNSKHNDRRYKNPTQPEAITYASGWDSESWLDLLDIWAQWHLNDMRAGCEHQIALGWRNCPGYHKDGEKCDAPERLPMARMFECACGHAWKVAVDSTGTPPEGSHFCPKCTKRGLTRSPQVIHEPRPWGGYVAILGCETLEHYNNPGYGHPKGHCEFDAMSAPCPECGYHYGSAWRRAIVPQAILDKLASFPDADIAPAWV